jgi:hypothetical protein
LISRHSKHHQHPLLLPALRALLLLTLLPLELLLPWLLLQGCGY